MCRVLRVITVECFLANPIQVQLFCKTLRLFKVNQVNKTRVQGGARKCHAIRLCLIGNIVFIDKVVAKCVLKAIHVEKRRVIHNDLQDHLIVDSLEGIHTATLDRLARQKVVRGGVEFEIHWSRKFIIK